jgi:HPt (histidine-containing phosphotransfer) domain-containing protein
LHNKETIHTHSKLYDLTMIQSVSGGDEEFIKKMIALFIETVPHNIHEMVDAVNNKNWDQAGKMAHKLKSTIDSMGIKSIRDDIRKIESLSKEQKQLDEIPPLVLHIRTVIDSCIEQLRAGLL